MNDNFWSALKTLKANTECTVREEINTEEKFNNIEWTTGVDANGNAITTTSCPHEEITWTELNTEMQRLQTLYDAEGWKRNRKAEYPPIGDQLDMLWHSIDESAELKQKYFAFYEAIKAVKAKYPK